MNYSLLLHDLDHPPTRLVLEEISNHAPGITRADCAGLVQHWLGIVTSNLELSAAQAFQAALRSAGYQTDIVPDHDIPALHSGFRCQRIAFTEHLILLTDAMGKSWNKPRNELVFAAAGIIERQTLVTKFKSEFETPDVAHGDYISLVEKRFKQAVNKTFFRIDLFFISDPHRITLEIDADSVIFYEERPIRLKDELNLKILMTDLNALLPPNRVNTALRERSLDFTYSGLYAYQEEIRWAFYRLGAVG